jgi:hypothetical protein
LESYGIIETKNLIQKEGFIMLKNLKVTGIVAVMYLMLGCIGYLAGGLIGKFVDRMIE